MDRRTEEYLKQACKNRKRSRAGDLFTKPKPKQPQQLTNAHRASVTKEEVQQFFQTGKTDELCEKLGLEKPAGGNAGGAAKPAFSAEAVQDDNTKPAPPAEPLPTDTRKPAAAPLEPISVSQNACGGGGVVVVPAFRQPASAKDNKSRNPSSGEEKKLSINSTATLENEHKTGKLVVRSQNATGTTGEAASTKKSTIPKWQQHTGKRRPRKPTAKSIAEDKRRQEVRVVPRVKRDSVVTAPQQPATEKADTSSGDDRPPTPWSAQARRAVAEEEARKAERKAQALKKVNDTAAAARSRRPTQSSAARSGGFVDGSGAYVTQSAADKAKNKFGRCTWAGDHRRSTAQVSRKTGASSSPRVRNGGGSGAQ